MARTSNRRAAGKAKAGQQPQAPATCRIELHLPGNKLAPPAGPQPPWRDAVERALFGANLELAAEEANGILTLDMTSDYGQIPVEFAEFGYLVGEFQQKLPPLLIAADPAARVTIARKNPELPGLEITARFTPSVPSGPAEAGGTQSALAPGTEVAQDVPPEGEGTAVGSQEVAEGTQKTAEVLRQEMAERVRPLFAALPADARQRLTALLSLNAAFHDVTKGALQTTLDVLLRQQPPDSYADKQVVASLVNRLLRETGFAIVNPESGRPASVMASRPRATSPSSTFHLKDRHAGEDGTRHTSQATKSLDRPIELVESGPGDQRMTPPPRPEKGQQASRGE